MMETRCAYQLLRHSLFIGFALTVGFQQVRAQYTDVINSNRPGNSNGAYAVGTGVIQLESGYLGQRIPADKLKQESWSDGLEVTLRLGLWREELEMLYEGVFQDALRTLPHPAGALPYRNLDLIPGEVLGTKPTFLANNLSTLTGWSEQHRLGFKYLIYDRFKDPERNKPNVYSWRANNRFQLRNLIPSVALYVGANYIPKAALFFKQFIGFSPRVMVITQSRVSAKTVLTTNISYNRIGTDFKEWGYVVSLSHNLNNPRWSVFVENQGYKSDFASNMQVRGGAAFLLSPDFQADLFIGANPEQPDQDLSISGGISYRLDFHKDQEIESEPEKPTFGRLSKSERRVKRKVAKRNKKRNRG